MLPLSCKAIKTFKTSDRSHPREGKGTTEDKIGTVLCRENICLSI